MKSSESERDEVTRNVLFKSFRKENEIIDEVVEDVFVNNPSTKSKTRNSKVSQHMTRFTKDPTLKEGQSLKVAT